MRYMLLIYSREDESATPGDMRASRRGSQALIDETSRRGIFSPPTPSRPQATATTVQVKTVNVLLTDGPFI